MPGAEGDEGAEGANAAMPGAEGLEEGGEGKNAAMPGAEGLEEGAEGNNKPGASTVDNAQPLNQEPATAGTDAAEEELRTSDSDELAATLILPRVKLLVTAW